MTVGMDDVEQAVAGKERSQGSVVEREIHYRESVMFQVVGAFGSQGSTFHVYAFSHGFLRAPEH